jgi:DNA-binding transcriptional MerR regulator
VNLVRKQLTISEVSKLLNISIHTIRYYEKEGLISPSSRTDGGYRLYDMDALSKFGTIVLFRECGISLKAIKSLMIEYSEEKYTDVLDESFDKVCLEIDKLTKIKERLDLVRSVNKNYVDGEFKIVKKPRVVITPLEKVEEAIYDSPKKLYDFFIKQGGELFADYDSALYFTMIDGYLYISSRVSEVSESSIEFEKGKYLSYFFTADITKLDMNESIGLIESYILENAIEVEDNPLICLSLIKSMAIGDEDSDIIEISYKII